MITQIESHLEAMFPVELRLVRDFVFLESKQLNQNDTSSSS